VGIHVLATSFSNAKRAEIGCGPDYEPLKKSYGDVCTNLFQSRADGWDKWCGAILRTMQCRPTPRAYVRSGTTSLTSGDARFGDAVREIAQRGTVSHNSWQHFCLPCE
jgi:hypothetical protein